jgi:hypothetical protein
VVSMMLRRDRRRPIDTVIDYFGEWGEARGASAPSDAGSDRRVADVHRLAGSLPGVDEPDEIPRRGGSAASVVGSVGYSSCARWLK